MKEYNSEKGFTLVIVLMILVLLSVLGLSLLKLSSNTLKISKNERADQSVYYIAEAGVVERRTQLRKEVNNAYSNALIKYKEELIANAKKDPSQQKVIEFSSIFKKQLDIIVSLENKTYNNFEKHFGNLPFAKVRIGFEEQGTKIIYTINSTGSIKDTNTERTVSQKIIVELNSATLDNSTNGNYAVYARNKVEYAYYDIKNNVNGSIASSTYDYVFSPGPKIPIKYDPENFNVLLSSIYKDKLEFNENKFRSASYSPSNSNLITNNSLIENNNWSKFNDKTLLLSDNLKLSTFSISNGGITFTIDVGDSDKILYVNKLELNGYIHIIGSGKLTIFVENEIIFGNTFLNQKSSPNNLDIYYAGNKKLDFSNNIYLNANMYIKEADLNYQGGGGLNGSLYSNGSGNIKLSGGIYNKSVNFIAPNYDVTVTGGATVAGSILCDNLTLSGGASIKDSSNNNSDGSISIKQSSPIKNDKIVEQ